MTATTAMTGRVRWIGWQAVVTLPGRARAYGRVTNLRREGNPMYPGRHARERADQAAFIMASTGESVSYAEFEARTNRLAHLLRARGLGRGDHYAIFMENNDRYLEACGAGERAGLYYTCVNSYLTAPACWSRRCSAGC